MIHLIEDYYMSSDDSNFIFMKWKGRIDKKGTKKYEIRRYYTTLRGVMRGFYTQLQRDAVKNSKDLTELGEKLLSIEGIVTRTTATISTIPEEGGERGM